MKLMIVVVIAATLLAGCSTLGESPEQVAADDDASCTNYGFKPGTDAFAQCRLQLAQGHNEDDRARRARMAAVGAALMNNQPRTCSTMASGSTFGSTYSGYGTTTCY